VKIYLMRHGEASFDAKKDDDRELTENGRAKTRHNIALKQNELASARLFLSSPIRRAQQTAKLAHVLLKRQDAIETVDWLSHESMPRQAIEALSRYTVPSVMLFSHQPFASCFAELLCGEETGTIAMNTASIIAMECDPVADGFGKILWQLL
jgi:phosphohistidine phosphatase